MIRLEGLAHALGGDTSVRAPFFLLRMGTQLQLAVGAKRGRLAMCPGWAGTGREQH